MRWTLLICVIALCAALLLPLWIAGADAGERTPAAAAPVEDGGEPDALWFEPGAAETQPRVSSEPPEPIAEPNADGWDEDELFGGTKGDASRWVTVQLDNGLHWMRLNYYLYGVVAGEMPASFPAEALRAQAVAARTYTLYKQAHLTSKHPQAEVCGNSGCCKAYASPETLRERWGERYDEYMAVIMAAVDATDGEVMMYDQEPILAVFHSTSSGQTERSADIWGEDLPYLQSVTSVGEDASPRYEVTVTLTAQECKEVLLAAYPNMKLSGKATGWFKSMKRTGAGAVTSVKIGGVTLTGGTVRKLFGLNSTNFTVKTTKTTVSITTRGYGHGVGMSQYGARGMALEGYGYEEILEWYYTGAKLTSLPEEDDV